MIKEKTFYKSFMVLALSLALQNLLTYGVNLMDTMMLGRYSQDAMGGVSLCNQVQFLLQMLVVGAGEGAVVMGSQYWGKNKLEPIPHIIGVALRFGGSLAVLMFGIVLFFPHQLLSLLSNSPTVIAEGEKYFQIICFTYIIFTITNILVASLRSIGVVKIGYMISGSTLIINVCLNYCLIYGHFGFPELGAVGAAIATLTSRVVEFLIVVIYTLAMDRKVRWRFSMLFSFDAGLFRDYLHVGLPLILSSTVWGLATSAQTAILGRLGQDTIAANSIVTTIFQVVTVLAYGAASASSVIIGKTVGENDIPRVKAYTVTLQLMYLIIGLLTSGILWLCKDFILGFYSITPETHDLAIQFIAVLSVTVIGTTYECACLTGIVTGGGDTRFVLINDLIHQWLIVIPSAYLSAFVFHAPLWVTFACLKSDQILKCFVAVVKVNRYRWIRVLTRPDAPQEKTSAS